MNKKLDPQVQYFCKHEEGTAETVVQHATSLDQTAAAKIQSLSPTFEQEDCFLASLTREQIFELAELPWVKRILTRKAASIEAACGGPMDCLTLEALEWINGKR